MRARRPTAGIALVGALAAGAAIAGETPLPDGGFENGPPPYSSWSESTNRSPECPTNIGDWDSIWSLPGTEGTYDYWAGGACLVDGAYLPIAGTVGVLIQVPASEPLLRFRYAAYRVDPDDPDGDDVAHVRVNGVSVWSLDVSKQSSNTFDGASGGFVDGMADLCAAAGSVVFLTISLAQGGGSNVANVRFDDFRMASSAGLFVNGFECGTNGWSAVVQ